MPPVEAVLEENAQLKAELSARDARIAELEAQIAWFRRLNAGRTSAAASSP